MTISIDHDEGQHFHVDRTGFCRFQPGDDDFGVQGMCLSICGVTIEFEDERDAVAIAKAILLRMGE